MASHAAAVDALRYARNNGSDNGGYVIGVHGIADEKFKRKAVVMLGAAYRTLALSMCSLAAHSLGMTDVTGDSFRLRGRRVEKRGASGRSIRV